MKIEAFAIFAALALAGGTVAAQDAKKDVKPMTAQECKDYMALAAKDATKKDPQKDTTCADMAKKDGGAMKKDEAPKK